MCTACKSTPTTSKWVIIEFLVCLVLLHSRVLISRVLPVYCGTPGHFHLLYPVLEFMLLAQSNFKRDKCVEGPIIESLYVRVKFLLKCRGCGIWRHLAADLCYCQGCPQTCLHNCARIQGTEIQIIAKCNTRITTKCRIFVIFYIANMYVKGDYFKFTL